MTIPSAPFGAWPSPVSRELLVAQVVSLGYPRFDGDTLYWEEMRPNEGGRGVVVRQLASGIVEECFGPVLLFHQQFTAVTVFVEV